MIIEYIRYTIPEAQSAQFERDYLEAGKSLDASEHCLAYELSRCTDESTSYILRIEWDSVDGHMKEFRNSAEFRSFFTAVKPYVNQIAEMRHYIQTAVVAARKT